MTDQEFCAKYSRGDHSWWSKTAARVFWARAFDPVIDTGMARDFLAITNPSETSPQCQYLAQRLVGPEAMATAAAGERAWLVETQSPEGPRWAKLTATGATTCNVEWVPDSLRATHLSRHEDAIQIANCWPGSTITEHIWGDAPLPVRPRPTRMERGPDPLGAELARLLGMPPLTQRFTLRCDVGKPPQLICEYIPSEADSAAVRLGADVLQTVRAEYELILHDTTAPAAIDAVVVDADGERPVHPDGIPPASEAGG